MIYPPNPVPIWVYSPTIYFAIPVTHLLLLRSKRLSNGLVTAFTASLMIGFPLLFPCEDFMVHQQGAFTSMITFVLRAAEIGTFPREVNSKFTVIEYAEFLATSDNSRLRQMRETQAAKLTLLRKELKIPEPQPKWKPHTTAAKDRGLIFYGQLGVRVAVTVVCYSFALAYFKKHDYEPIKFGLLSLLNGKGLMDHAMAAVLLYGVLDLGHTVATLLVAILLQTPYVTIFNHPYLATSLRDFWSHRWNYEIKETLHHLAFIPTLKLFAPKEKEGVRAAVLWKPTSTEMGIASMAAFLMSALLHEYLIYLFIPQPLGENTLFFIIQGILCHAQVRAQKATGFGTRWGTGWMGTLFSWVSTVGIMAVTCPLFLGPYARSGLLLKYVLPVPQALVEFFSRYL